MTNSYEWSKEYFYVIIRINNNIKIFNWISILNICANSVWGLRGLKLYYRNID